jgi:hypothetical protein
MMGTLRFAHPVPSPQPRGVYQIGEVYARSWVFIGTSSGSLMLNRKAS